jgi:uncharacterized membrane protein
MERRVVKLELEKELTQDLFNRYFRWLIIPALLIYICFALFNSRREEVSESTGITTTYGKDSGLQMTLLSPFPPIVLWVHTVSGVLLVLLSLLQKTLIYQIAKRMATQKDVPRVSTMLHKRIGYAIVILASSMSIAGFCLSPYSAFDNFVGFSVLFASPWITWAILIYISAKKRFYSFHRLTGNMLVKGCIAVPLSRITGAYFQQYGWDVVSGYYQGIGLTTIIIFIWELRDIILFLKSNN